MNLLNNPSFEEGAYEWQGHDNIRIPNGWNFWHADESIPNEWDENNTPFSQPEANVLHKTDIPPEEWDDFFVTGDNTWKCFGAWRSIFIQFSQLVTLLDHAYQFSAHIFPDLYNKQNGDKEPATDPQSGMIRAFCGQNRTTWQTLKPYLSLNYYEWEFLVAEPGDYYVGIDVLLPHPLENNGFFTDAFALVDTASPTPRPYVRTVHLMPQNTGEKEYDQVVAIARPNRQSTGFSLDDALVTHPNVTERNVNVWNPWRFEGGKAGLRQFAQIYYPPQPNWIWRKFDSDVTPPPDPPPQRPRTKACYHMQRAFDNWRNPVQRAQAAGVPMAVVKVVDEGMQKVSEIRADSPDTLTVFRLVSMPERMPDYFIYAEDPFEALNNSTFAGKFDEAAELGYDIVETPVNEAIGTHNIDQIKANVRFDVAYAQWCRQRSGGRVAPGIITPGGGNPDHGYETGLLAPAARAVIEYGGYLMPHTYFPVRPEPDVSERWMASPQVQLDYHLRPILSWLPTFDEMGIDISKLRFIFGESGPCGAHINEVGLPGGYKDAGCGWRRWDALNGNLDRCLNLLVAYENLCQEYPQVVAWTDFTQGFAGWDDFQFNSEWELLYDILLS